MTDFLRVAVKAIIQNTKGEVLILKRINADLIDGGLWDLPVGRLLENETNDAAFLREVQEETGLRVSIVSLHTEWHYATQGREAIHGFTYLCIINGETDTITLSLEHSDYRWIKTADIDQYMAPDNLKAEIKRITGMY